MIEVRTIDPVAYSKAIVALWNRRLGSAFPLDERLLLQQLRMETGQSLCIGAFESPDSPLVGIALAKLSSRPVPKEKKPEGYLSFIVVDEAASRKGVGSAILGRIESWLAESHTSRLQLGSYTYHFFPGLPLDTSPASVALEAFLEARGFKKSDARVEEDLIADVQKLDLRSLERKSPLARGYRILPRPGKTVRLDFPMVATGEITGTAQCQGADGPEPLAGLRLELVRADGGFSASGLSGYDGGKLKKLAQHNLWVDVPDMQIVEDIHAVFGHLVLQALAYRS